MPGHYYQQIANHLATEETVNKTKTPQDKLIAKMESSFVAKWEAKQKKLGVKFGPIPEEDEDITKKGGTGGTSAATGIVLLQLLVASDLKVFLIKYFSNISLNCTVFVFYII